MKGTGSLSELYAQYGGQVEFIKIYIREAHPVDGWWLGRGPLGLFMKITKVPAAMDVYDPKTIEERQAVAGDCADALRYGIRTYVDEMDDAVNRAYAAWPTRLYLIGRDGRIVYHGGPGPYGFKPADLGAAIEHYLAEELALARVQVS